MHGRYKAVIFDLFGTLIGVFSVTAFKTAVTTMAEMMQAPHERFTYLWEEGTYQQLSTGGLATIDEALSFICRELAIELEDGKFKEVINVRYEFTRQALQPLAGVVETLSTLKQQGYKLGLVSNCSPDVVHLWEQTPFAQLIDVPIFSCQAGWQKPDPRIYRLAAECLNVTPEDCLYVGDGSDRELSGAKAIGMHPVLIQTPLHDAYDQQRADLTTWNGHVINSMKDLLPLLQL
ncbi:HAD family hydrolase [Ktedonobacter racemifer]|uniref:HAD-superfamily hydrolase, subfamily IA, variant 3 n=1 Tax=Ktedonobacter racemifer DSM 44963 TaxID=485913 RepID=D6TZY2_KTERA|nr:HAD family hydrolase [Ktedonobacter racemifer]EFH82122.1 HAD-superfamily hydrolase, subfamily IA, variant 3 [Ktedonobacter racemifer DSM 44963]